MDELDSLPTPIQQQVREYLDKYEGSKLITTRMYQQTPYKDKSIVVTNHKAYLEYGNLMTVLSYGEDDNGTYNFLGVLESSMIVGDIRVFLEESTWFEAQKDPRGNEGR